MPRRATASSQAADSNWDISAVWRPEYMALSSEVSPAMWYSGAAISWRPIGVPSAQSLLPIT